MQRAFGRGVAARSILIAAPHLLAAPRPAMSVVGLGLVTQALYFAALRGVDRRF
jgi:hypothetical protein